MKSFSCALFLSLLIPLSAHADSQKAQDTIDAYFEALRNEEYARVADMITAPEIERFKSIWTAFVIVAEQLPQGTGIIDSYAQGQSAQQLEKMDPKESLIRFLRLASTIDGAREAIRPPIRYKVERFTDSPDLPSLIINYDTEEGNVDTEYRFETTEDDWKLFLPDPILHAVNTIGRAVRQM